MENGLNMDMMAVCQKRAETRKKAIEKHKELRVAKLEERKRVNAKMCMLTAVALILATAFICFFWEYAVLDPINTLAIIGLYESAKFILGLAIKLIARIV